MELVERVPVDQSPRVDFGKIKEVKVVLVRTLPKYFVLFCFHSTSSPSNLKQGMDNIPRELARERFMLNNCPLMLL